LHYLAFSNETGLAHSAVRVRDGLDRSGPFLNLRVIVKYVHDCLKHLPLRAGNQTQSSWLENQRLCISFKGPQNGDAIVNVDHFNSEMTRSPRVYLSENHKPKRSDTLELHASAVVRVICSMRKRLDKTFSLKEMAALAYMSRFHFNRTFRSVTGLPPRRFLSALRVQSATRMLLDTNSLVTDICLDVGYSSLGTFVRRFSSVLGVSPQRLRSIMRSSTLPLNQPWTTPQNAQKDKDLEPRVTGRVLASDSFSGLIFIGLFTSPIPEGAPLACTIMCAPGPFLITRAPKGQHFLFALGLPWPQRICDYFNFESALRGGGNRVCVGAQSTGCEDIYLRGPKISDPPILVNLPRLLAKNLNFGKAA
jgi:AraC family transcriptional regulator